MKLKHDTLVDDIMVGYSCEKKDSVCHHTLKHMIYQEH